MVWGTVRQAKTWRFQFSFIAIVSVKWSKYVNMLSSSCFDILPWLFMFSTFLLCSSCFDIHPWLFMYWHSSLALHVLTLILSYSCFDIHPWLFMFWHSSFALHVLTFILRTEQTNLLQSKVGFFTLFPGIFSLHFGKKKLYIWESGMTGRQWDWINQYNGKGNKRKCSRCGGPRLALSNN